MIKLKIDMREAREMRAYINQKAVVLLVERFRSAHI